MDSITISCCIDGVDLEVTANESGIGGIAYEYDGSLEGLLTAVFQAYARHENPVDVRCNSDAPHRLGQTVVSIQTNVDEALRVQRGIQKACGPMVFDAVRDASLSDEQDAGTAIYTFIRYAMSAGQTASCAGCSKRTRCQTPCGKPQASGVLSDITNPAVEPVFRMQRHVLGEAEKMRQFIRFQHKEDDVWFARCNPNAAVIPLIMGHFAGRFNTQKFVIYDENHQMSGVYDGQTWYLVKSDAIQAPPASDEEDLMQHLWRRYYQSVSIDARYNPELRQHFMPKRLWSNITELQEGLPDGSIRPSNRRVG